jgi:hypothetical protein
VKFLQGLVDIALGLIGDDSGFGIKLAQRTAALMSRTELLALSGM